jgi:hypothetical protein
MSYMQDERFQERVLALAVNDRRFLRRMTDLMSPEDFVAKNAGVDAWAREQVARLAMRYWRRYREPVGDMLRAEALEFVRANRQKLGISSKYTQALLTLCESVNDPVLRRVPDAVEEKYRAYKRRQVMRNAIEEFTTLQMKGELDEATWMAVTRRATRKLGDAVNAVDYGTTLEQRIRQRARNSERRFPLLFIDPLDAAIRTIPRGQVGLWLAPYKAGKSTALVHTAQAHAMQGFGVLFFTLEDPVDVLTDRLDASLLDIPVMELAGRPNRIRNRWQHSADLLHAKIKTVDATGGGWTVERLMEKWDTERSRGFTADVVIVDYDAKIEPSVHHKGESAFRMQSNETYNALTNWAAKDQIYIWTAAQTKRVGGRSIITGDDTAEDINKPRNVGLAIGIGSAPKELELGPDGRYLYIAAHKFGKSHIGWPIVGDFDKAVFFDRERSLLALQRWGDGRRLTGNRGNQEVIEV